MTTRNGRRPNGSLEAEVMAVLWQRGEPTTGADVQDALETPLAYNTVQTILTRLWDKGVLLRRKAGRGHLYWPAQDAASTAAARMSAELAGRTDRQAVLQQFAASLNPNDAALLRDLLREM